MRDNQTFAVLFILRRERADNDKIPIYLRVTINGKRAELSIKRKIEEDKWSSTTGRAIGNSESVRQLNEFLNLLERKVYLAQKQIVEEGLQFSAENIKTILLGKSPNQKTLVEVFEYHNKMLAQKVGLDHAKGTYDRYTVALKHVKDFLQHTYKQNDILLSRINHKFATDFHHYLVTVRHCNHNTTSKYIKNLKRVLNLAMANEWLSKDPFINFKTTVKPVERQFLSPDELYTLESKQMPLQRLDQVRDLFVFACYTGLSYIDVSELKPENVMIGIDNEKWIFTHRHKTDIPSHIPLLPKAVEILEKYKNHPITANKSALLPVISNQRLNAYLKEIATLCEINKNLTFHVARHTFATTVTLTNGVSIESVSSMLGHTSIKTTQIYAKVVQQKVSSDMLALKQKLYGVKKESKKSM